MARSFAGAAVTFTGNDMPKFFVTALALSEIFCAFLLSAPAFGSSTGTVDTHQVRVLRGNVSETNPCQSHSCSVVPRVEIVRPGGSQSWSVVVVRIGKQQEPTAVQKDDRSAQSVSQQGSSTKEEFHDVSGATVLLIRGSVSTGTVDTGSLAKGTGGLATGLALDKVAFAVEGVESSHGQNPAMWRDDLAGPQGPMQVSAAAALDVGGGNRFDFNNNKLLGRAYLSHLYTRYGNWPDAIAAYNWGPGRVSSWIAAGRPEDELPISVHDYLSRVLKSSGSASAIATPTQYDAPRTH